VGFFDSIKGIGRAVGGALESIAGQVLPVFAQAGTQFLLQKAFPGQSFQPFGTSPVFPQGDRARPPFPGEVPFGFPPIAQVRRLPPPPQFPQLTPNIPASFQRVQAGGALVPQLPLFGPPPIFTPGGFQVPPGPTSRGVGFDIPGIDLQLPFRVQEGGIGCPSLFSAPGASARPVSMFMVPNPVTGKPTFFKHAGRPILFSGDLRACKTVNRIAARARRTRGR